MTTDNAVRLPWTTALGWGVGSLGAAVMISIYSVFMLRFMTDYLGVAAATAGLLFAASKVYDAVTDPLMGVLTDRTDTKIGRRRPWLLFGVAICPLSMVAMFVIPGLSGAALAAYLLMVLLLFATAYTVWTVPYMAMAAEMTDGYHERSRLMSFKVVFGASGQLVGAIAGSWLIVYLGSTRLAYERASYVLAAIVMASCLVCFLGTSRAPFTRQADAEAPPIAEQVRLALGNAPFMRLLGAKLVFFFGSASAASSNAYFTKYVLQTSDVWLGSYYTFLTVGMLGSIPMWLRVGRRLDKKRAFLAAMSLYGVANLSWVLSGADEPFALRGMRVLLVGAGLGGFVLLGQSMLPDAIAHDRQRTGLNREGTFMGLFSFVDKVSGALGVAVMGLVLGAAGYVQSIDNSVLEQPARVVVGIYVVFAVLPACSAFLAVWVMGGYDLDETRLRRGVTGAG